MSIFDTLLGQGSFGASPTQTGAGPVSASGPYDRPGQFKDGIWMVLLPDGHIGLYSRNNLPPVGTGAKYYWLGSTLPQINSRTKEALGALTGKPVPATPKITQAELQKIMAGSSAPVTITPGPGSPASFFGAIGDAVTSSLDFFKLIAWIFHPRNLLRAVEFLVGLMLMVLGLRMAIEGRALSRGSQGQGMLSETPLTNEGLNRVANNLAASMPSTPRNRGGHQAGRSSKPRRARSHLDVRDLALE